MTAKGSACVWLFTAVWLYGCSDPQGDDPFGRQGDASWFGLDAATADGGVPPDASATRTDAASALDASSDAQTDARVDTGDSSAVGASDMDGEAGIVDSGVRDPGTEGDGKFTVSDYPVQPALTDQGATRGRSFRFVMDSTQSVIFDGSDPTLNPAKPRSLTRQIDVYVPASYRDGDPAPLLVIQDGPGPIDLVSRALDNLTQSTTDPARRLPAFIAIAVQNGGNDAKGSERGLEYDTLSDRYARFIELEVLPAVLADADIRAAYPNLAFTSNPEGKATYGCSSGGAAAFTMAWFRPDLFRRAITYSGTFVAQQNDGQPESAIYPLGAWEYHASQELIANTSPNKPIRTFLNVNSDDLNFGPNHDWPVANQRMFDALDAKGYHVRYVYAEGRGHCDWGVLQATLADTLVWTWAGYPND